MQLRASRAGLATAAGTAVVATIGLIASNATVAAAATRTPANVTRGHARQTASPIKHLVVIFQENVSYDHYFGTYPKAKNTDGTRFYATSSTPENNNLQRSGLLISNPNQYAPSRLSPAQAVTCDQDHGYAAEQKAYDGGKMDAFVQNTEVSSCSGNAYGAPGLVMDYYDGNTVTGLWNYAQQFAMSDNSFDTTFGPSTPGALNLVSGQTHGFRAVSPTTGAPVSDSYVIQSPDRNGVGTVINDSDPAYDDCSDSSRAKNYNLLAGYGPNIGNLLTDRGITWGWFEGGFRPTAKAGAAHPYAVCGTAHQNVAGATVADYIPHHEPFQYYASTANPHHLPPSSIMKVGQTDQANHQYDMTDFNKALSKGVLPAVSFLKAPAYQDGHAGYSDPIDEQHFLVSEINALQKSKFWSSTAVVIAYDDSDGWYDHVASPIRNASRDPGADAAICTSSTAKVAGGYQDRCGPGPRLPLLVISPWSKTNFIDHHPTEQASILSFIEDNWFTGRLGDASFDARAGSLANLFDFTQSNNKRVLLRQNGSVASIKPVRGNRVYATR